MLTGRAWTKAASLETGTSGFRSIRIYPFNPKYICSQHSDVSLQTVESPMDALRFSSTCLSSGAAGYNLRLSGGNT